jgi:hypothetical protein
LNKRKKPVTVVTSTPVQNKTSGHTVSSIVQKASTPVQGAGLGAYQRKSFKLRKNGPTKEYWVRKWNNFYVLNGDIIVGDDLPKHQLMSYSIDDKDDRWPNATMPIVVDQTVYDNGLGDMVHNAIMEFNTKTKLCLVRRTNEEDYIKIVVDNSIAGAGSSKLGRQGDEQVIFIKASVDGKPGIDTRGMIHELMHAAGFIHEQSRPYRENHVYIKEENVFNESVHNFELEEDGLNYGAYDFCSIMHYSNMAFSGNGKPTIECHAFGTPITCPPCMGNDPTFSSQDIKGIDGFYDNVSRFPCGTPFVTPTPLPVIQQFPTVSIPESDKAMQSFRHRADLAAKEGFAGAFPNFHEAQYGPNIVGGTIFLKHGMVDWRDIPHIWLGSVPLQDFGARMRATQQLATALGYVGGYPNFHHANYGSGIVCGTMFLPNEIAEWRDVPWTELGSPPLDNIRARMTSANDYAYRNGYLGGFPTFFQTNYGKGIVCGIILIKKEAGEWRDVILSMGPR